MELRSNFPEKFRHLAPGRLGTIAAGSVYRNLATQVDPYPTLVALTESQHSATTKSLDGEDISAVLLGTGSRKGDEFVYYSAITRNGRKEEQRQKP